MEIIARIESDFLEKFGIPRQSGLVPSLQARIVMEKAYRDPEAFKGLEEFSHIWLLWQFSETISTKWTPTVRPPRLGGETHMGVFATRSPFRPNPLGLSCVKLEGIAVEKGFGPVLYVSGADLMSGTPIYDIKPYLPFTDAHPEALCGFAGAHVEDGITVKFSEELLRKIPEEKREALLGILTQDPRPAYQNDPERIYGIAFGGYNVRFRVTCGVLSVCDIEKLI